MFCASRLTVRASGVRSALLRPSFRTITTVKATDAEETQILVAQRKNRPVSPHLAIYQKQLTAVLSAFHRITGVGLAVGFYGVTAAYGLGFTDTAGLIGIVSALPAAALFGLKAIASFPFAFHGWNGIRHLIWDAGYFVNVPGVYKTGYTVLGLTVVSALALIFI
ncbi:protein [Martiniozyma asiatica (nom. inval.)]|nr:protein [Martiniozyma asiatica]